MQKSIITKKLTKYSDKNVLRFDVPGHKNKIINNNAKNVLGQAYKYDINSTPGLDNLNHPVECLKDAMDEYSKLFNTKHARFLINGSTIGIQTMIMSTVKEGEIIIVPSNSHKSVDSGLILSGAKPIYAQAEYSEKFQIDLAVTFETYKKLIDEHKPRAILILNPTYHGITTDLKEIINYAKKKQVITLVDEAHGGHFKFINKGEIRSAMDYGADLSTHSAHKTLGALTQAAVLLHNDGLVDIHKVDQVLTILQTTSPSYILLASLDEARVNISKNIKKIEKMQIKSYEIHKKINKIKPYQTLMSKKYNKDYSKLVIKVNEIGLSGFQFYELLRTKYLIQPEIASEYTVTFVLTYFDSEAKIKKLIKALLEIVKKYKKLTPYINNSNQKLIKQTKITPRQIFMQEVKWVNFMKSNNYYLAEDIMLYPPGIAFIKAGKKINKNDIQKIKTLIEQEHLEIHGISPDYEIAVFKKGNKWK